MTFSSKRRAYEKAALKALSLALKGTRWKKNQNAIFCVADKTYIDVVINVHLNTATTVARISAKPMTLDEVYWRVTGLQENNIESLSFRTWGAFTCSSLPMAEKSFLDEELSPNELANLIIEWGDSELKSSLSKLEGVRFSDALLQHPNQVERGAYAISYVASLIDEGSIDMARKIATSYADGTAKSVHAQSHCGRDFHKVAVQWIDSNRISHD